MKILETAIRVIVWLLIGGGFVFVFYNIVTWKN